MTIAHYLIICSGRGNDEEIKSQTNSRNHLSQVGEITTTSSNNKKFVNWTIGKRHSMSVLSVRVNMKKSNLTHTHLSHKKFRRRELVTRVREFTIRWVQRLQKDVNCYRQNLTHKILYFPLCQFCQSGSLSTSSHGREKYTFLDTNTARRMGMFQS